MFIKADEDEEEEMPPQDTTTTDKLGDEIEARSSTLRASSLLKDNVFTKEGGDGAAEDFLEVAGCPSPVFVADVGAACSLDCSDCSSGKITCTIKDPPSNGGPTSLGKWHICCNGGGNQCSGSIEEEEILQDTDKLDASSPLRASLLKVE